MSSYKLAVSSIQRITTRGGLVASYKVPLGSIKGCTSGGLVASYKLALMSIMGYTSRFQFSFSTRGYFCESCKSN